MVDCALLKRGIRMEDNIIILQDIKNFINELYQLIETVHENGRKKSKNTYSTSTYHDGLSVGYAVCLEKMSEILKKHETSRDQK